MNIEYKELVFDVKAAGAEGEFEGYASVFGVVDLGNDVVQPGAFAKSLNERKVKMLWQHDTGQPIGVWTEIREDDRGLYVRGKLILDVQRGKEAAALLKAGALDSMSIGFRTVVSEINNDSDVRKLVELELHEISLVTFPMLPDAMVTSAKSIKTEREFEKFLRDAGYSKAQSVAIASHGYKAVNNLRDADHDARRDAEADDVKKSEDAAAFLDCLKKLRDTIHHGT